MKRITERFEAEITVKKSRFIAIAMPVTGLDDVKGIVKSIWDEHKDATHVVHAAVAGANGSLFSCSDDREPKNTAGRPALQKAGVYYSLILAFVSGAVISGLVTPLAGRWTVLCACPALLGAFFLMLRPGRA